VRKKLKIKFGQVKSTKGKTGGAGQGPEKGREEGDKLAANPFILGAFSHFQALLSISEVYRPTMANYSQTKSNNPSPGRELAPSPRRATGSN